MARVWDELHADSRRRADTVVQTAAESLGGGLDDLEQKVRATEQTRLLTATAMDAGMRTAWPPKLRALGRALANALTDADALVDEDQLIIGALADLEAPHARVLDLLLTKKCMYAPVRGSSRGPRWEAAELLEQERPPRRYAAWESEQIMVVLANLSGAVPTVLGTLQRHGLVQPAYNLGDVIGNLATERSDGTFEIDTSGPDEPTVTWSATHLGLRLHELLQEATDD